MSSPSPAGITTAINSLTGTSTGVGFAIPARVIEGAVSSILGTGA